MPLSRLNSFFTAILTLCGLLTTATSMTPDYVFELHSINDTTRPPDDFGPPDISNCSEFRAEEEFVLLGNGSLFVPQSNSVFEYHTFFVENNTAFICEEEDDTFAEARIEHELDLSDEFISCTKLFLEPGEFELKDDGQVHVSIYSKSYKPTDYYLKGEGVFVCMPVFEDIARNLTGAGKNAMLDKFPEGLGYVTFAGLGVSIICLLMHLVVFCSVPAVRNLPGCCLASLSLSLLIAYLSFLAISLLRKGGAPDGTCSALGFCIYYFFLTSFFWMNAIAFDVWRSFRVVMRELRISSHRIPWRRFLCYSLYSWLIPAGLAVLVKAADTTDILPASFKPDMDDTFCWFGRRKALIVFFAAPLIVVMLLNAAFFLDVTYVISRATLKTSQSHEATLKKRFFMFVRLALIMGLAWIVGLIAGYLDVIFLWYVFIILNTLQGLFIFVVFSCSSKVRGLCCKKYGNLSMKRGSTSVRTISQTV